MKEPGSVPAHHYPENPNILLANGEVARAEALYRKAMASSRELLVNASPANQPDCLQTIHDRHDQIHQDHVRIFLFRTLIGL
jgi:hypothetical protein